MPIFGKKDKSGNLAANFALAAGFESWSSGSAVRLVQNDEKQQISIEPRLGKSEPLTLNYSQIIKAEKISETEISEKKKSVVGRAVVGDLLLGPLGAVIGGVSGTGKKEKSTTKEYFVINYHPMSSPRDLSVISFEIVGATLHFSNFLDALQKKITSRPISHQL
ncbi:hypothetical protein CAFE_23440 [Caprobacter fermentans]|uniref:Uncharacterized protein n=1 Tax=Caproicibacter fermentans TaxID=2576756 RepID=A0A6N8I0R7_9FIRM|nr:hypothetical protein [Caproicibacter fermentans]MVB11622.1 hypothetical protein [Caproicibacter fermentans]